MTSVAELIENAVARVSSVEALANGYLANLLNVTNVTFSNGFNVDSILPDAYNYASVPEITIPVFTAARPNFYDPGFNEEPPSAPVVSFSSVDDIVVPDLGAIAPVIGFPTAPSSALPTSPGTAPEFQSPDIPTAPSITLPAVPTFAALSLPDAMSINLPSFDAVLPVDDLVAPTSVFTFAEGVYDSMLLDPLKAKLLADLVDGGYGIETADEIALFNRARDREVETMLSRVEDAGRAMALRGFPLPPGELSIHVDRAYQDMQNKVSSASRDITLTRTKLFVDNRQFTIEQVRQTEQILIAFHNSVQERALNVARTTVEMGIALFNALVARYNARMEGYKATASVFEARIRGELAKAEIYKTQIEGKALEVSMHKLLVDVYLAQLKGVEVSVDIYKTQMEAAKVRADIERIRMEAFRSTVEAYTSQVQAKVAEFGMFTAQVNGEKAKADVFEAQVRGYLGQVQASKVRSDIQLGRLQTESEQAKITLLGYQGEIDAYKANLQRLVDGGKINVDIYRSDIDFARMRNDASLVGSQLQAKVLESTVQQNIQISQMTIADARAKLEASVAALNFRTAGAQFGAQQFFAVLTALVNSIGTLAVQTATE